MKVRIRDLDVNYEESGTGRPMLVLHGGGPIGCAAWARGQYEPIFENRSGWRFVYPDQMGHGLTPVPSWLTHHDQAVDLLIEFMETVAPGERWVVSGVSWGGYHARGLVHHRLNQLDGMFVWVPDFNWLPTGEHLQLSQVIRHDAAFDAALRPDERWLADMLPIQTVEVLEETRRVLFVGAANNPDTPVFHKGNGFSFDPDALSEPFRAPVLIVSGRKDAVVGYLAATEALDLFPRGTHVVLDRCGHIMAVDQPILLKALANEWLDRVEEYVGIGFEPRGVNRGKLIKAAL